MANSISSLLGGIGGINSGAARQLAQQQAYGQMAQQGFYDNTNTYTTNAVTMAPEAYALMQNQLIRFHEPSPAIKKAAAPRRTGRILLDLRKEIDDWHGDILRAA